MYVCRCAFGPLPHIQCRRCLPPPVRCFGRISVVDWKVGVSGDQAGTKCRGTTHNCNDNVPYTRRVRDVVLHFL
jgi:hypothetical protein